MQAWYNQFLAVDPANANHVFLGLEEVFEIDERRRHLERSRAVLELRPACSANGLDSCPPTTHPDQHAVAIANGKVYVGNDGGVYTPRPGLEPSTVRGS